ncbi:putative reverse transcriptase domain-containing protein [Tanacetum coccineum]
MKCQPLNFKGTKGVVGLSQWLEKMESVFHISGCAIENQVKFATCTLLGAALTWWNGHMRTLGHDAAYAMTWEMFKKKLTDKYCPNGEIKKKKGSKPLCPKCNYHHDVECAPKCTNCKKVGHLTKDCWRPINGNKQRTIIAYECGESRALQGVIAPCVEDPSTKPRNGCLVDESLVIPLEELHVDDKLHFVEEPVEVMDSEIKQLKRSRIPILKVRWNSKRGPEYQLHFRLQQYDLLFRGGRLFQQYVVGVFCAVEQKRLDYKRKKQNDIRSDYLSGLYDAISRGEPDGYEVGGRIILPMSFTGGPRYMYAHYLDALAIF